MRRLSLLTTLCGAVIAAAVASFPSQTRAQTEAAASASRGIDPTFFDTRVRPQDNFYRFANGAWLARTEIAADRAADSVGVEVTEKTQAAVRALIEEAVASDAVKPGTDAQKVRDLYRSHMDTARIDRLGLEPLQSELARIAAIADRSQLSELFAHFARIGVQSPIGFSVAPDERDATRYVAYASQDGLGLPDRENYLRDDASFQKIREAYQTHVAALLRAALQPEPEKAAENVFAFETQLAEKHWDRARSRDREATYSFKTVRELETLTRTFSWPRYLEAAGAGKTPGVVVRQPDYFQALDGMLTETPLAVLKQYLVFKLLDRNAGRLSQPFRDAGVAFRGRVLAGLKEPPPRSRQALGTVTTLLGEAVGRMYVERHFPPTRRKQVQELISNVIAAYGEGIDRLDWMSRDTKTRARAKLAKLEVYIGYPDQWKDYSDLEIRGDDLMGNVQRATDWAWTQMVSRLGRPVERSLWSATTTPLTVNAGYSSSMNAIVFPAAFLQPPLFDPQADAAVNYGGIGGIIGHEIGHAFDDRGSRSDAEGNLREWWTVQDRQRFMERTRPLIAQYAAFEPLPGHRINGELTLSENLADLIGWSMAYRAYRRSLAGRTAPVIDGYTGDQRFFLARAQLLRSKVRDEALRQALLSDNHSPREFRINGALRNMPEFHEAFGVKAGDAMFLPPGQRVKVW